MEKQTTLFVKQAISDKEWHQFIEEFKQKKTAELLVLPTYLQKAKYLLAREGVKVGTCIDYPLACGTNAKIAFEVGEMYRLGADFLQISLNIFKVKKSSFQSLEELVRFIRPLGHGQGELRYSLDMDDLLEVEKIHFAQNVEKIGMTHIVLNETKLSKAIHDVSIFYYDAQNVTVSVNLPEKMVEDRKEFDVYGVKHIGQVV